MAAISDEEKQRRRRITDSVIGINVMEGQTPDAATLAIARRYDNSVLTLERFPTEMDNDAYSPMRSHRILAGVA